MLRVVSEEEFLHAKINNKQVYVDYGATEDIPTRRCMQFQEAVFIMDGDLTGLN